MIATTYVNPRTKFNWRILNDAYDRVFGRSRSSILKDGVFETEIDGLDKRNAGLRMMFQTEQNFQEDCLVAVFTV